MRIEAWEGPEDPQMKLQPSSNQGILRLYDTVTLRRDWVAAANRTADNMERQVTTRRV